MKQRIGKIEARAIAACEAIKNGSLSDFSIEWRKSACWGRVAAITYRGEKAAEASGCGYDKESACLVAFLYPLTKDIGRCGGAGLRTVQDRLKAAGWILTHTFNGKHEDGYRIERAEVPAVAA